MQRSVIPDSFRVEGRRYVCSIEMGLRLWSNCLYAARRIKCTHPMPFPIRSTRSRHISPSVSCRLSSLPCRNCMGRNRLSSQQRIGWTNQNSSTARRGRKRGIGMRSQSLHPPSWQSGFPRVTLRPPLSAEPEKSDVKDRPQSSTWHAVLILDRAWAQNRHCGCLVLGQIALGVDWRLPPLGEASVSSAPASLKTKSGAANSSSQKPVLRPVFPGTSCEVSTIRIFTRHLFFSWNATHSDTENIRAKRYGEKHLDLSIASG